MNTISPISVEFAPGAVDSIGDEKEVAAIKAALTAYFNGGDIPEGIEVTKVEDVDITEDDIKEVVAQYPHLSEEDKERLAACMRGGFDEETFFQIVAQ